MTTQGDTTATVLDGLTPETRYQVSVFAVYGHGEGQPLVGEETTDSKCLLTFYLVFFSVMFELIFSFHSFCSIFFIEL